MILKLFKILLIFLFGLCEISSAQSIQVIDSVQLGSRQKDYKCHYLSDGTFLLMTDNFSGIVAENNNHQDTLKPIARNLVLHCVGKFCYFLPRPNAAKWKPRNYLTFINAGGKMLAGLNSQSTDLAFYNFKLNIQASHPIDLPHFSGAVCLYHNYFSAAPIAFIGDTMAMLLLATQVMGDSTGKLKGEFPEIAFYDLTGVSKNLPDTIAKDTLQPFRLAGEYSKQYLNTDASYMFARLSGIGSDTVNKLFFRYQASEYDIRFYDCKGEIIKTIGEKGKFSGKGITGKKKWKLWYANFPQLPDYWRKPAYGDVLPDLIRNKLYRIYYGPLSPKLITNYHPERGISTYEQELVDYLRPAYLQVYSYPEGKLLNDFPLSMSYVRLLGFDSQNQIVLTGVGVDGYKKYSLIIK